MFPLLMLWMVKNLKHTFFLRFMYFVCMTVLVAYMYCTMYVPGAHGG